MRAAGPVTFCGGPALQKRANLMTRRGVYFLADDGVYPWTAAFLCSFRRFNPQLPLCLVPYNDRIERLRTLQHRYQFSILDDRGVFERCAAIAAPFHPDYGQGHYRKLACWEGPFDEFIYIDVDTIVQRDFAFAFSLLRQFNIVVASSNMPSLFRWVWKPSIYSTRRLSREQIAYSANTGFIVSRKWTLTTANVLARLGPAAALAPHMALLCIEQPLLNYLFVTSGRRISSLSRLGPPWPQEWYAGVAGGTVRNGQLLYRGHPPLFVHWPGQKLPWPQKQVDRQHGDSLHRVEGSDAPAMPYYDLWRYYWDRAQPGPPAMAVSTLGNAKGQRCPLPRRV